MPLYRYMADKAEPPSTPLHLGSSFLGREAFVSHKYNSPKIAPSTVARDFGKKKKLKPDMQSVPCAIIGIYVTDSFAHLGQITIYNNLP